jgi:hypothetical protein
MSNPVNAIAMVTGTLRVLCKELVVIHFSRFQFRVCLLNENHDPISSHAYSTSFLLAAYTSGRSVDQYILKQAQKARRITSHIRGM